MYMLCRWKESEGQQFRLHQQNELSTLILNKDHDIWCWKSSPWLGTVNPDCYMCTVPSEWSYHMLFFNNIAHKYLFPLNEKKVLALCRCFMAYIIRVNVMVFNATFNNISNISSRSALLAEKSEYRRNHRPVTSHWQTLPHAMRGIRTHNCVVIDTHSTASCKSNYHTITTTASPI